MSYFYYQSKRIYYTESGNGAPVLFLHGNTASSKMFELLLPLYEERFHVILIDFKSDRHAQVDQLKTLYARQISIYQRCLHQMYPEKQIQAYLYSFDLDQFIEMTPETELAAA